MRKILGVGVVVLVLAGCSGGDAGESPQHVATATHTPTVVQTQEKGAPKTLAAATAAATELADRWSSGDFAGVWQMMDAKVRKGISEADYVTLNETCSVAGLPMTATGVRMDGTDKAIVRLEVSGFKQSRTMAYEEGKWVQSPTPDFVKRLGLPVDQIIAAEKAEGGCTGAK